MKLILASGSKDRQALFNLTGWKYTVVKSIKEEESNSTNPREYVMDLSRDKAESVSKQISEKAVIIAADTIMYMGDKFFEKPSSLDEAYENMKLMSGNKVSALTGVTIKDMYQNKVITFVDTAEIYLNKITNDEIKWYIKNESNILNCSGFSIDGKASLFINKIVGDYNTIVGISISKVYLKLKELGYSLSDFE